MERNGMIGLFKWAVMAFSAGMTVYSVFDAFGGGVMGWGFGLFGIFLFEGAALYWQHAETEAREGQLKVAQFAQWVTMTLSLLSTVVGIALLSSWGSDIRLALPLGPIMIALIGVGLAANMFWFLKYQNEEPDAKRLHMQRQAQALRAQMVSDADMRALKEARVEMERKIADEAPILGAQLADDGIIRVRENVRQLTAAPSRTQLPAPRQPQPVSDWKVSAPPRPANPTYAFGGGNMPKPAAPRHESVEAIEGWKDDDDEVQNAPVADPKGKPRVTGTSHPLSHERVWRPLPKSSPDVQVVGKPYNPNEEMPRRMGH